MHVATAAWVSWETDATCIELCPGGMGLSDSQFQRCKGERFMLSKLPEPGFGSPLLFSPDLSAASRHTWAQPQQTDL
jgi:hypothetical protein